MFFGLTNAPFIFQMKEVFKPFLKKNTLVFFIDILVHSKNKKEHIKHLNVVLRTLAQQNLYFKIFMCQFTSLEVEYLGQIITKEGVRANQNKVEVMISSPNPKLLRH